MSGDLEQEYFSNGTRDAAVMQTRSRKVELPGGCNRGVAVSHFCHGLTRGGAPSRRRCARPPNPLAPQIRGAVQTTSHSMASTVARGLSFGSCKDCVNIVNDCLRQDASPAAGGRRRAIGSPPPLLQEKARCSVDCVALLAQRILVNDQSRAVASIRYGCHLVVQPEQKVQRDPFFRVEILRHICVHLTILQGG
jgi:hypothetical protein